MDLLNKGEEAAFELSQLLSRGFHSGWLSEARTSEWAGMLAFKLGVHARGDNFGGMRDHFKVLLEFFARCKDYGGPPTRQLLAKCLQIPIDAATRADMQPEQSRRLLDEVERMLTNGHQDVVLSSDAIEDLLGRISVARERLNTRNGQHPDLDRPHDDVSTGQIKLPSRIQSILCRAIIRLNTHGSRADLHRTGREVDDLIACLVGGPRGHDSARRVLERVRSTINDESTGEDVTCRNDPGAFDDKDLEDAVRGLHRLMCRCVDRVDKSMQGRIEERCEDLKRSLMP